MDDTELAGRSARYDEDFVAWSKQQAAALRAVARAGSNLPIDWENLAEEVEVEAAVETELTRVSRGAIRDLQEYGEVDSNGISKIRAARYTAEKVLGHWLPPGSIPRPKPRDAG